MHGVLVKLRGIWVHVAVRQVSGHVSDQSPRGAAEVPVVEFDSASSPRHASNMRETVQCAWAANVWVASPEGVDLPGATQNISE
jgi:hypothetical protein